MSKRPIRDKQEAATDKIPNGPLGLAGGGKLLGAVGFAGASLANGLIPFSDMDIGYRIRSHNINRKEGETVHTMEINAFSKDTAKFVAKSKASPSNIEFFSNKTEIKNVEQVQERKGSSTWRVKVVVDEPDDND